MFTHPLVPTDGSALSESAIQMAGTFAVEGCAKVTGLYVIPVFMSSCLANASVLKDLRA
jgi:nucleotide-binding universal stress UspA family protein